MQNEGWSILRTSIRTYLLPSSLLQSENSFFKPTNWSWSANDSTILCYYTVRSRSFSFHQGEGGESTKTCQVKSWSGWAQYTGKALGRKLTGSQHMARARSAILNFQTPHICRANLLTILAVLGLGCWALDLSSEPGNVLVGCATCCRRCGI